MNKTLNKTVLAAGGCIWAAHLHTAWHVTMPRPPQWARYLSTPTKLSSLAPYDISSSLLLLPSAASTFLARRTYELVHPQESSAMSVRDILRTENRQPSAGLCRSVVFAKIIQNTAYPAIPVLDAARYSYPYMGDDPRHRLMRRQGR